MKDLRKIIKLCNPLEIQTPMEEMRRELAATFPSQSQESSILSVLKLKTKATCHGVVHQLTLMWMVVTGSAEATVT